MSVTQTEGLVILKWGLCNFSVCVPSEWTTEQIESAANLELPTGISSRWTIDEADHFSGPIDAKGNAPTNPSPCEQMPERTHYLLSC